MNLNDSTTRALPSLRWTRFTYVTCVLLKSANLVVLQYLFCCPYVHAHMHTCFFVLLYFTGPAERQSIRSRWPSIPHEETCIAACTKQCIIISNRRKRLDANRYRSNKIEPFSFFLAMYINGTKVDQISGSNARVQLQVIVFFRVCAATLSVFPPHFPTKNKERLSREGGHVLVFHRHRNFDARKKGHLCFKHTVKVPCADPHCNTPQVLGRFVSSSQACDQYIPRPKARRAEAAATIHKYLSLAVKT